MLQVSDRMAQKWNVTREECDTFALRSQMLAKQAMESGFLDNQIMPVVIPATKKTPEIRVEVDEHPRPTSTMDGLAKLRAVNEGGVTTAGNASGRNDGASMLLVMSEEKAKALGYTPLARWVCGSDVGVDPKLMGIGPAYSNMKVLQRMGMKLSDIDVFECNEAFAAQNLGVIRQMEEMGGQSIDMDKWNPNGGAIAFGHPNGASGGRIALSAIRHLENTKGQFGLISSCCGGGLGVSALFERV
jgi:acetyl-CoA C-acetyltransferase